MQPASLACSGTRKVRRMRLAPCREGARALVDRRGLPPRGACAVRDRPIDGPYQTRRGARGIVARPLPNPGRCERALLALSTARSRGRAGPAPRTACTAPGNPLRASRPERLRDPSSRSFRGDHALARCPDDRRSPIQPRADPPDLFAPALQRRPIASRRTQRLGRPGL